jgi:hypothetical protein
LQLKSVCLSAASDSTFFISSNISSGILRVEKLSAFHVQIPSQANALIAHYVIGDNLHYATNHSQLFFMSIKNVYRSTAGPQLLPAASFDSPTKITKIVVSPTEQKVIWGYKSQLYYAPTSVVGSTSSINQHVCRDGAFTILPDGSLVYLNHGNGLRSLQRGVAGPLQVMAVQLPPGTQIKVSNMLYDNGGGYLLLCNRSSGFEMDLFHLSRSGSLKKLSFSCSGLDHEIDGILAVSVSPEGSLFIADSVNVYRINLFVLRNPLLQIESWDLEKSIDNLTDTSLTINGATLSLHRALITERCPGLLLWKTLAPISVQSVRHFVRFLYTDELELNSLSKTQVLELAVRRSGNPHFVVLFL